MKVIINPAYQYLSDFIHSLTMNFDKEGEIIYTGRNILKCFCVKDIPLVVKSFKKPYLINKIAYTFFRKSKARRSYEHGMRLMELNCPTPEPIAYVEEYKSGLLNHSYYVCLYEKEAVNIRDYVNGVLSEAEDVLHDIACFSYKLHQAGVLHIDYSPGNILMRQLSGGQRIFSLVDINRLHFKPVSKEEALCNFDRLCLSVEASTKLAVEYARCCSLDEEMAVRMVNAASDRFFGNKAMSIAYKRTMKKKGVYTLLFGPIQYYLVLRNLRLFFYKEQKDNFFFKKEQELYNTYIKEGDFRHVLCRRFRYEE